MQKSIVINSDNVFVNNTADLYDKDISFPKMKLIFSNNQYSFFIENAKNGENLEDSRNEVKLGYKYLNK